MMTNNQANTPVEKEAIDKSVVVEIGDEEKSDKNQVEEGEEDEEVYIVEAILEHKKIKRGGYQYLIKWQGFPHEENTWEDEDNILSKDLLDDYWKGKNKGKDSGSKTQISKKRKTTAENKDKDLEENGIELTHNYPPEDLEDWESEVVEIETIERNSKGELIVYIVWKNGCHTSHNSKVVNERCPQKIIEFYQNHLKFLDEDQKS
ncbi:chromo-domain-containing protein [Neoconidiobolus thromboides FSU 785]|nr:chromo-domain-containing protein [Neoconidiobolus thromboides FSU 785]